MTYKIYDCIWHSDKDVFDQGCVDGKTRCLDCDLIVKEKSEIIAAIFDFIGIMSQKNQKKVDISLNACDELGRIDFCFESIGRFQAALPSDNWVEKWKKGEKECFSNCVSFYIDKIETFDCSEIELK